MFANRRKRVETNKATYFDNLHPVASGFTLGAPTGSVRTGNLVHTHLSSQNGISSDLQHEDMWRTDKHTDDNHYNIYNTNTGGISIGKNTPPHVALDVSGGTNVSTTYTINYVSIAPPIGSIMAYTVENSPDGWLICNGSQVSRETYSGLFAVIGTTFGSGDGNSTFHLPNYQGAFLRGTGTNGIYSGPGLNMPQAHATQKHSHTAHTTIIDPGHFHTQSHSHTATVNDPGHAHTLTTFNNDSNGESGESKPPSFGKSDSKSTLNTIVNSASTGITASISANNTPVNISTTQIGATTRVNDSTLNIDPNETRPYNYGVYWIIKY